MKDSSQNEELHERIPSRFEVRERLGEGAFGTVFRVLDRKRRSVVGLKLLHAMAPDHLYQFKREFRALADISHPHLIDLFELFGEGEVWFFTMDYIEGDPFGDALAGPAGDSRGADDASTSVDEGRLRTVFGGLASGLHALHELGNFHRDLKPENVLVTEDDHVVLLDFGLVAEMGSPVAVSEGSDASSPMVGTPRYLAPELATEMPTTEASDWYSAGVMLYEVLTGRPPITGRTTVQELFMKNTEEPTDVREFAPRVSDDFADLCMDLLAIDPEDRPDGEAVLSRLGVEEDGGDADSSRPIPTMQSRSGTFVGRDAHLRRMNRIARDAFRGETPAIVHVCGDSGVGKTSLVREFLERNEDPESDLRTLWSRCFENESVPYKAFDGVVDQLVPLVEELPDDEIEECLGEGLPALARLFPVLRRVGVIAREDIPLAALSESEIRDQGFDALRRLFARLAETYRLVVCIDDVQWGDEDSVHLLEHLIGGEQPPPAVFLLTWRTSDAETSPFLEECLKFDSSLEGDVRITYVELSKFSEREARQLAAKLTSSAGGVDGAVGREVELEEIVRESGGHPLFVSELSRRASRTGAAAGDLLDLDEIWVERIDDLPGAARSILEVVSVAGRPLDRELVRDVADVADEELPSLSALRSQRLVRVRGTNSDELQTYHDRIREVVVERLEAETLREMHGRLAEALLVQGEPDPATLASHFERAGDHERAAAYSVEAAEAALDSLALERASRLFERALELGDWSRSRRHELSVQVAELHRALGRGERAAEVFLEAAELVDGLDVHECRLQACEQLLRAGEMDRGRALLDEQLVELGFEPTENRYAMLASILYNRWRLSRRGFDYELRAPKEIPRRTRLLLRGFLTATTMFGVTDVVRGTYFHYLGILRSLESGYPTGIAALFCQQAAQDVSRGVHIERSRQLLDRAEEVLPHCETAWGDMRALHRFMCGIVEYFQGEWSDGLEGIREAVAIYEDSHQGYVWETEMFRYFSFDCLEYLGKFRELRERVSEKLEQAVDRNDDFHKIAYGTKSAVLRLCDDDPEQADRTLRRAKNSWQAKGFHVQDHWVFTVGVEAALYRGDVEMARKRLEGGWGPLRRSLLLETRNIAAEAWSLFGRVAVSEYAVGGGWEALRARYRIWRARRRLQATGLRWAEGFAALLGARLHCAAGRDRRAMEAMERAESAFEDCEMAFHRRSVQLYRGIVSGSDGGHEVAEEARQWMEDEGIVAPGRMARVVLGIESPERGALPEASER